MFGIYKKKLKSIKQNRIINIEPHQIKIISNHPKYNLSIIVFVFISILKIKIFL